MRQITILRLMLLSGILLLIPVIQVCRKCIYKKLSDDEVDRCPVCNIDLGCLPVEKLRPDHNLQDIRAKIFPLKRRKVEAPEVTPTNSLPVKRKERSLSSLVVSTPKMPIQTGLTGRRTKAARKAAAIRGCSFAVEEPAKKEDSAEDHPLSSSSHDSQNKTTRNKRQDYSVAEPSNDQRPNEETENDMEIIEGKVDLWTPLNCLVEAANRTKSSKSSSQGPSIAKSDHNAQDSEAYMHETKARPESPSALESEVYMPKSKRKEHGHNARVQDETNGPTLLPGPVKRRRLRGAGRKSTAASGQLHASAQVMLDVAGSKRNRRNSPIWFSLVASEDRKADVSLPQISACYLRIK
ncbi:E3 ubiquitin protein ligase DRIP1 [Morella rubra]|uniref:E3 ubiquitin protein ligase DRIP1 n=1 Tax=Morella rubra TaxID=262757 RepID=A0A6A1URP4_9ROSI|nr:E3 ubiquitin protein ligase DRIP1 [Morella rubra]